MILRYQRKKRNKNSSKSRNRNRIGEKTKGENEQLGRRWRNKGEKRKKMVVREKKIKGMRNT